MDVPPHLELLQLMEEISEAGYYAGWMSGLEYDLWEIVERGQAAKYGDEEIDERRIARLRSLGEQSNGWWAWSEEFDGFPVLVPLHVWRARASARAREH